MNQKLDTAGVFERLFEVYRAQFTLIVPAAILVFLPVAIINGAVVAGGGIGLLLLALVVSTIGSVWLQGMVIEAVRDIEDGRRDFTLGELFRSVMPVLLPLFGVGLLAGLGIALGFVLLIVPGLILLTWWAVVAPVVVIERRGLDAFGRSRELVRGNGWQVFGVIVVVFIIQFLANNILGAIFGGADSFVGALLASLISNGLIAPLSAIAAAIIYLELRRVKGEAAPHAGAAPTTVGSAPESPFGGASAPPGAPESPYGGSTDVQPAPPAPARPDPPQPNPFGEGRETETNPFGDEPDPPRTPPPTGA
jgi:hypothetical protein